VLASPAVASKRWVWEQYDHMIFLGTVRGPGSDAAVVRLPETDVAVAIAVDGPGRYCYLDPYEGARLAVAESARNVACVGGRPLAVTNCLNFGNPEKPDVMWQFAEVVRGIGDACRALDTPVTGGNVSFYNETSGRAIFPTPVIGMLGVVESPESSTGSGFTSEGDSILLLGATEPGDFGGSEYAKVVNDTVAGRPPGLDLARERGLHAVLAGSRGLLASAHDVSDGGLAVALAESALAGGRGFSVDISGATPHRELFSETPSRALVSCAPTAVEEIEAICRALGIACRALGTVGGSKLDFGCFAVTIDEAKDAFEMALPAALSTTIG
jgi:phosphoribosylformylglycinamidine synthase